MRIVAGFAFAIALASAANAESFRTEKADIAVETVAKGLSHPWAIDFLPDGRMIVTERAGRLRIIDKTGKLGGPIRGLPDVDARG